MLKRIVVVSFFTFLIVFMSNGYTEERSIEMMNCPDKPNCVSSKVNKPQHFIAPFSYNGTPEDAMDRLKAALLGEKRVKIVAEQKNYLHAEVRSFLFRFVDDVEFSLAEVEAVIHLRSASRTGYSDFGVNRRRIERIRQRFQR